MQGVALDWMGPHRRWQRSCPTPCSLLKRNYWSTIALHKTIDGYTPFWSFFYDSTTKQSTSSTMLVKEWLEEPHLEALGLAQVQQCQDGNLPFLFKVGLSIYCSLESPLRLQTLSTCNWQKNESWVLPLLVFSCNWQKHECWVFLLVFACNWQIGPNNGCRVFLLVLVLVLLAYNWWCWMCCSWLLVPFANLLVTLSIIMDLWLHCLITINL